MQSDYLNLVGEVLLLRKPVTWESVRIIWCGGDYITALFILSIAIRSRLISFFQIIQLLMLIWHLPIDLINTIMLFSVNCPSLGCSLSETSLDFFFVWLLVLQECIVKPKHYQSLNQGSQICRTHVVYNSGFSATVTCDFSCLNRKSIGKTIDKKLEQI